MPTQNLDSSPQKPSTTLRSEAHAIINRLRGILERLVHIGEAIHGPAQKAGSLAGSLQDKPVVAPPGTPPVANSVSEAHALLDKIESVVGETVRKL